MILVLSGFVSTNTTQILQARKQIECDNKQISRNKQFNNHNNTQDKNNKIPCSIYVRLCVYRKQQWLNKNDLFARVYVCVYMLGKSVESMFPLLAEVKKIKKLTLLMYMCMRVCIYVCDRKYGPFVLLSPHMRFF